LDNFGDCEEVLNAFLGNLLSFGSFGSRVPYYKAREKAFTPLLIHRNKNVQSWAEKVIDIMKRNIELEKREDEERDFTRS